MRIIIDRFEGDFAVVELGNRMLNVPRALFCNAHEGDTVEITVLGKVHREGEDPHELFEQLRKPKRSADKRRKSSAGQQDAAPQSPSEVTAASPEDA